MRNNSGFTLMEMLIAIGVIGVLTAVAIPNFIAWQANRKLSGASREVLSALQFARLSAVKENDNVVIWFNDSNNTYRAYVDSDEDKTQDANERTVKSGTLASDITIDCMAFTEYSNQTGFNNRGLPAKSGDWGYVCLKNNQNRYKQITLGTTGHSKIESGSTCPNC